MESNYGKAFFLIPVVHLCIELRTVQPKEIEQDVAFDTAYFVSEVCIDLHSVLKCTCINILHMVWQKTGKIYLFITVTLRYTVMLSGSGVNFNCEIIALSLVHCDPYRFNFHQGQIWPGEGEHKPCKFKSDSDTSYIGCYRIIFNHLLQSAEKNTVWSRVPVLWVTY